ncbi:hypothetical protein PR048_033057 [Dryococelus australis]|uniref:DUF4371 domain-containing protein n=1 Tax=Dryococelus australis TaxID=614101 RepID=A0ABQ9FZ49_9NEOP|nr:hypothetical protein PR048_033057 [Dryococelus australis]
MTNPEIENEMLEIFGHEIVSTLYDKIKSIDHLMFSVICDGTQDASGLEEESFCIWWVAKHFETQEIFLVIYQASTTGEAISRIICDVLMRMHVRQKCVHALISDKQPLVLFMLCGAHFVNVVIMECREASKALNSSLDWAHEVRKMFSKSVKVKSTFAHILQQSVDGPVQNTVDEIVRKYDPLVQTLEELSAQKLEKASGLVYTFQNEATYLRFVLPREMLSRNCDQINNSRLYLQAVKKASRALICSPSHVQEQ